jgi:hypothetical protein
VLLDPREQPREKAGEGGKKGEGRKKEQKGEGAEKGQVGPEGFNFCRDDSRTHLQRILKKKMLLIGHCPWCRSIGPCIS